MTLDVEEFMHFLDGHKGSYEHKAYCIRYYYSVMENFADWFLDDIFVYHSSPIGEFLNNIRWAIYEYLQPEFRRSWHLTDDAKKGSASLKAAADRLAITPAAVGQRIKTLEDYLGLDLVTRGRSGLRPTAALSKALPHLAKAFHELSFAAQALDLQRVNEIQMAANSDWVELWLMPRLPRFRADFPNILFSINGEGDVPMRHWFRLGRALTPIGVGAALLLAGEQPLSAIEPLFKDRLVLIGGRFEDRDLHRVPLFAADNESNTRQIHGVFLHAHKIAQTLDGRTVREFPAIPIVFVVGVVGFCFGGGQVWSLLAAGEPRLAAAAPFYGPGVVNPDFAGSKAAVLGVYAEKDTRVNGTKDAMDAALTKAGLVHELRVFPGVDHAFFNDTGARYDAPQAAAAYQAVLDWFGRYL